MSFEELFYLGFFIYSLIGILIFIWFTYSIGGTKNLSDPKLYSFLGIFIILIIFWLPIISLIICALIIFKALEKTYDKDIEDL